MEFECNSGPAHPDWKLIILWEFLLNFSSLSKLYINNVLSFQQTKEMDHWNSEIYFWIQGKKFSLQGSN